MICYKPDAEIKNAEWDPPTSHPDEDFVKATCSMNVNCLGYWKRPNNPDSGNPEYGSLVAGTRTWVKDKQPNTNVKGVWKKSSDCLPGKSLFNTKVFIFLGNIYYSFDTKIFLNKCFFFPIIHEII